MSQETAGYVTKKLFQKLHLKQGQEKGVFPLPFAPNFLFPP
jgi:hypothetical protein